LRRAGNCGIINLASRRIRTVEQASEEDYG
jgi:hypothetical protein